MTDQTIVVLLKGYPRLSETFIAQELLGLERAGFKLRLVAMRRPTDKKRHPAHDEIQAPVTYLPEYLHEEPRRVLGALWAVIRRPGFRQAATAFLKDLRRDFTRNRLRRFGQAAVLVAEWPLDAYWLHVHFIHTPASVARYAGFLRKLPWTVSAHAKDIWTSPDWELTEKLAEARWAVTCTKAGHRQLSALSPSDNVHLSYHGLDLDRFLPFVGQRPLNDGSDASKPVRILSVGRAVKKKGYDTLLAAFSLLPKELAWTFTHIGGGDELAGLKEQAGTLGLTDRLTFKGALDQRDVLQHYRDNDLFALACRITADGDRDGLPNVLVEASSQALPIISTNISGICELFVGGENGFLVEPDDPTQLAEALEQAIRNPSLRQKMGKAAEQRVRRDFDHHNSINDLKRLFSDSAAQEQAKHGE